MNTRVFYLSGNLIKHSFFTLFFVSISNWIIFSVMGLFTALDSSPSYNTMHQYTVILREKTHLGDPLFYITSNLMVILQLIGGAFTLGFLTLASMCLNGYFFGFAIGKSSQMGMSVYDLVAVIVPHGIFELPALWLAGAAGLKGPQVFIRYLRGGQFVTKQDIKEFLILSLTSIILIIIAGIIEATVTYEIAKNLKFN